MGRIVSQTPRAVRERAERAHRARERYTGTPVFPSDQPDYSRAERPCSRCSTMFQPSTRRRMMCAACFHKASPRDESGVIPWCQVGLWPLPGGAHGILGH